MQNQRALAIEAIDLTLSDGNDDTNTSESRDAGVSLGWAPELLDRTCLGEADDTETIDLRECILPLAGSFAPASASSTSSLGASSDRSRWEMPQKFDKPVLKKLDGNHMLENRVPLASSFAPATTSSSLAAPSGQSRWEKPQKFDKAARRKLIMIDDSVPLAGSSAPASALSSLAETSGRNRLEVPQKFDKTVIKKLVDNLNMSADASDEIDTPHELNVELLSHQKRAVKWMLQRETVPLVPVTHVVSRRDVWKKPVGGEEEDQGADQEKPCLGGLLCDEQGLGKTLTVIALMLSNPPLAEDGTARKWRSLIVCPVSLVGQWKEEAERRITRHYQPSIYIYHGPKRIRDPDLLSKFDIIITTYTTLAKEHPKILRNDPTFIEKRKEKLPLPRREPGPLFQCEWHRIVLDEAHTIKSMKTDWFAAACMVPAKIRWCLTGTPIQNSIDDVFSLFVFVRFFRMSTANWKAAWKSKIESPDYRTRSRAFKRLQPVVAAVTLRRTKLDTIGGKELISLPPRRMEVVETDFTLVDEAMKYNQLKTNSHAELQRLRATDGGLNKNYTGVLLLLLRLRQACCHPMLAEYAASKTRGRSGAGDSSFQREGSVSQLDEDQVPVDSDYERLEAKVKDSRPDPRLLKTSTKTRIIIEKVLAMRDRGEGEKCLIFSQWTSFLDIISYQIENLGFRCCRLDGSMSLTQRKEEVAKFRTDASVTVFLLSMHAAGTGLNLTEANNVILADSWWNPSVEAQCCDRAHRIGQTRPVQITRLKIKGTCEERIFELCATKAETCASALGDSAGKSSGRQKLSLKDALALFGDENDDVRIPDSRAIGGDDDALHSLSSAIGGMRLA